MFYHTNFEHEQCLVLRVCKHQNLSENQIFFHQWKDFTHTVFSAKQVKLI